MDFLFTEADSVLDNLALASLESFSFTSLSLSRASLSARSLLVLDNFDSVSRSLFSSEVVSVSFLLFSSSEMNFSASM